MKISLYKEAEKRVLILDGGLGTMVQGYGLTEEDYRGVGFASSRSALCGCNDLLVLTKPDVISNIHEAYLKAGADIISTDTFNATSVSLEDYNLGENAYQINQAAATLARAVADKYTLENPSKPRFVAGSMGPTNRSASMSADINSPESRSITFDLLVEAYGEQASGLLEGGIDLLLVETVFDTLNAKAALFAIDRECERRGVRVPIMVSGTVADVSGRILSGQTVEAYYTSLKHAQLFSIGLNCGFGARQLRPFLARLANVAQCRISVHPNAGLPNVMGGYDETPQMFADDIEQYLKDGIVNIVGGCCGTTPLHTKAIAKVAKGYSPRTMPTATHQTELCGLETLKIDCQTNFVNIGERTNVAGSAKFARLIREHKFEEALSVAREQVDAGAQIIDICMDDGMINGEQAMTRFLNYAMSEPEISRVPFVIDSSSWEVLEAGLKCVQGKCLVNSISLKEGEQEFVRRAKLLRRYGGAAIVMLFDERGQADVFERKIEVAKRGYEILMGIGFPPEDIVFDPNVLAVATGIEQHNGYGVDFIEACRWIKQNLPYAKVSGGVSNLSFSFRGNNTIREAMHSVFLFHAIEAGMDMGILNPAMLQIYSDIEPELLQLTQDVVLNLRPDATQRLTQYAEKVKGVTAQTVVDNGKMWRLEPLAERIAHAMVRGVDEFIEQDALEAHNLLGSPLEVIDTMLMPAMNHVGELFGQGKMFLPQVVKSARVMKKAVGALTPYIEAGRAGGANTTARILIATVKGDVHDIGKNIVSVVMSCNGYEILDLGVMVECEIIVDEAVRWNADVIGLSGLITPSLVEMTKVVQELQRRGLTIPVLIGGATTSSVHTAVKIAPHYDGLVEQCRDASQNIKVLPKIIFNKQEYTAQSRAKQAVLREKYLRSEEQRQLLPIAQARKRGRIKGVEEVVVPKQLGRIVFKDYSISQVRKYIDWNFFFPAWGIKGHYPELLDSPEKGEQARSLWDDAQSLLDLFEKNSLIRLEGVVGIYMAMSSGDDIIIEDENGTQHTFAQLRNQEVSQGESLSLADYIIDKESGIKDYICAFALSAGVGLSELIHRYKEAGDDYNAIMCKLLADRLTEAFSVAIHSFVCKTTDRDPGIRVAIGYPSCPDHSQKRDLFDLLCTEQTTNMRLTENYMIDPGESVCGFIFTDPKAQYFSVGKVGEDQLTDYVSRRGLPREEIERLIGQHL